MLLLNNRINLKEYNLVLNQINKKKDRLENKIIQKNKKEDNNIFNYTTKLYFLNMLLKEKLITEREHKLIWIRIKEEHKIKD